MKENEMYIIKMKEWSGGSKTYPGYTAVVQIVEIDKEYKTVNAKILNVLEDKGNFITDPKTGKYKENGPRTYSIEDFQKNSESYTAKKITPKTHPEYYIWFNLFLR